MIDPVTADMLNCKDLTEQLLAQAKEQGASLEVPEGLLAGLTKQIIETALDAEITEHLVDIKLARERVTAPVSRRQSPLHLGRPRGTSLIVEMTESQLRSLP